MSKRKTPVVTRPAVECPFCRGQLRATWNPTVRVILRLTCDDCDYSFYFDAYRTALKSRARKDATANPSPFPQQAVIPGTL